MLLLSEPLAAKKKTFSSEDYRTCWQTIKNIIGIVDSRFYHAF